MGGRNAGDCPGGFSTALYSVRGSNICAYNIFFYCGVNNHVVEGKLKGNVRKDAELF